MEFNSASESETPRLGELADRHQSDKGFHFMSAHGYTRVYEAVLRRARLSPIRLLEVGLMHPAHHMAARLPDGRIDKAPSLAMWADYLPNASIFGFDIEDFSAVQHPRIKTFRVDQGDRSQLQKAAAGAGGMFDLIIDDGSHASYHQQITLGVLWPFLRRGGMYIIEDLHFQPPDIEREDLATTAALLRTLQQTRDLSGLPTELTPEEEQMLQTQVVQIFFFDSLDQTRPDWPFGTRDALAVLQKSA